MAPWGSNLGFFCLFLLFAGQRRVPAGEAFPPLQLFWIKTETYMKKRAGATFVHQNTHKADTILSGQVDAKTDVLTKTSQDIGWEFITDARRKWADVKEKEARWEGRQQDLSHWALWEVTACNSKDTAHDCCLDNILYVSSTALSLKMTWIDCLTDEINPKINTSLWIRRIWLDLRAFFLGLISVMTDFPSNIEVGSPWGTSVPWKRICRVEWGRWEPFDTCVLLQWDGMHNACGFNQTSSARPYWGCYLVCDLGFLPEWDGVSNSWRPCFLQCTHVNTHRLQSKCTHTHAWKHTYNHASPSWSPPAPDVVLQHPHSELNYRENVSTKICKITKWTKVAKVTNNKLFSIA